MQEICYIDNKSCSDLSTKCDTDSDHFAPQIQCPQFSVDGLGERPITSEIPSNTAAKHARVTKVDDQFAMAARAEAEAQVPAHTKADNSPLGSPSGTTVGHARARKTARYHVRYNGMMSS
jgi:hypothetical protein